MIRCRLVQLNLVFAALTVVAGPAVAQATRAQTSNAPSSGQAANDAVGGDGLAWRNDRLTLSLDDGNFTISPLVRIDGDEVSFFDQNRPGGYQSGTEFRRNRYGVRGTFLKDFEYNFTWEFGSRPSTPNTIFEAQVGWNGLGWGTVRVGAFTLQHMPEFAASSYDLLLLERASITNVVTSLASGDTRAAVGLESRGARWNTSFYVSGGAASARDTGKQRGLVGRAVGLFVDDPNMQLQVGFDGAAQFSPGSNNGPEAVRFNDYPELRGTTGLRLLDTGSIRADTAYAVGPEIEGRAGPVYLEGVYQHVGLDAPGNGSRSFDGWYAQGAVPLLGPPRERVRNTGTWSRPRTQGWIDPSAGNWGSIEAVARYSTVDLRDQQTRGGRQRIWAVGGNWYLSPNLKIQAEWETGRIRFDTLDRQFQGVGFRAALSL